MLYLNKMPLMIRFSIFLLFATVGFAALYSSGADADASSPSLNLEFKSLDLWNKVRYDGPNREWPLELKWTVSAEPGWKIDWCEDEASRVTMEDSAGVNAPNVRCGVRVIDRDAEVSVFCPGWRTSPGARWVSVKGEVPFVVSRQEALSFPVDVKLTEGTSVPLVLKDAGLGKDGKAEDVKIKLVVEKYEGLKITGDSEERYDGIRKLAVVADVPVGIRDLELQTADGMPVMKKREKEGKNAWRIKKMKGEMLRASVRYSQHPQRCKAVIDGKVSLAGFCAEKGGMVDSDDECKNREMGVPCSEGGGIPVPGEVKRPLVRVELTRFIVGRQDAWAAEPDDPDRMGFEFELFAKAPASFGGRIVDRRKQSLEVMDSTGRKLSPAVFDLISLSSWKGEKEEVVSRIHGKSRSMASPGAEWIRVRGALQLPMGMGGIKESPVYELPLVKGAHLQIPVPGASDFAGDGSDVASAEDLPVCRLVMKEVKTLKNEKINVEMVLTVEGCPFELDGFDLLGEKDVPLNNVQLPHAVHIPIFKNQKQLWMQGFHIGTAEELKKLRVRLRYKTDVETVNVPVDCRIGLGGPLPRKAGGKRP